MKKIIALILATVMVMLAVAACGGTETTTTEATKATNGTNGTNATNSTSSTTKETTQATTEEPVVIPDPVKVVVYYAKGEDPVAVNIATNESVGKLTAGEGVELVQGNFYVAEYYNGASTALVDLGAAIKSSSLSIGTTNKRSDDNPKNPGKVNGGNWWKQVGTRSYDMNIYMDVAAMNLAMGDNSALGEWGTITIKSVDGDVSTFSFGTDPEGDELITDYKWNFSFLAYDGSALSAATGKTTASLALNQMALIRYANDIANGKEVGYTASIWQGYLDNYGAPGSTTMCTCEVCNGAISLQNHYQNEHLNTIVPVKYASALTAYNYIALDAEELKAVLDKADADLATAQTAFDTAIAANEAIAALKAAAEAEGATDEAKKAYTDALAADANLTALNTALTDAKAAQKTATTNYNNAVKGDENAETYTASYNEWKAKFEAFCAAYAEAANVALWDVEDMDNSVLSAMFKDVEDADRVYPTFTYYYDKATDTYTVFVTSGSDTSINKFW